MANIATLNLTAPSAGYVFLHASGWCNTPPNQVFQIAYVISTSPTAGWTVPDGLTYMANTTHGVLQVNYSTARVLPAVAGLNTYYLNIYNYTPATGVGCGGVLVGLFTANRLP